MENVSVIYSQKGSFTVVEEINKKNNSAKSERVCIIVFY